MPTTDHLNRVLDLISVAVNKRLVVTMDEADEAQVLAAIAKSKSGGARGGGQEVEILEDGVVRVACLFRSDQWATNRLEIPIKEQFNRNKDIAERIFLVKFFTNCRILIHQRVKLV